MNFRTAGHIDGYPLASHKLLTTATMDGAATLMITRLLLYTYICLERDVTHDRNLGPQYLHVG